MQLTPYQKSTCDQFILDRSGRRKKKWEAKRARMNEIKIKETNRVAPETNKKKYIKMEKVPFFLYFLFGATICLAIMSLRTSFEPPV